MKLHIAANEMKAGDVLAESEGGPKNTVVRVDVFGPLVIVDFADGTASPPVVNGWVDVIRPDENV